MDGAPIASTIAGVRSGDALDEELSRALVYRLLAQLLAAPPDASTLAMMARMEGDATSDLGRSFGVLAHAAAAASVGAAAREYHALFIGVGRGELLPYASFYLTGFLHERPLAELRRALATLGIERADDISEPEDHIAFLCEVMAALITGEFGPAAPVAAQREFFDAFLAPWAGRFFADLARAQSAVLYASIGDIGRHFLAVEQTAFAIA
jgi:TorA maturation chaperone TorD